MSIDSIAFDQTAFHLLVSTTLSGACSRSPGTCLLDSKYKPRVSYDTRSSVTAVTGNCGQAVKVSLWLRKKDRYGVGACTCQARTSE